MAYSIQRAVSDGTLKRVVMGLKYFDKTDLTVYVNDVYAPVGVLWNWDGDAIQFKAAVSTGYEVRIVRKTKFNEPYHIFDKGAMFKDSTIDDNFNQMLFLAQETAEGATATDFYQVLNFHGYRLTKVGQAVEDYDAVPLVQYKADAWGAYQSRLAADASRVAAQSAQSSASASAATAGSAASAADTSRVNAGNSESNALTYKNAASASATAAAGSSTTAQNAALLAQDWASKTSGPVAGGEYSAKYWAQQSLSGIIPDNAVTSAKILNGAVTTDKILDGAVTRVKLASAVQTELSNLNTALNGVLDKTGDYLKQLHTRFTDLNAAKVTGKFHVETSAVANVPDSTNGVLDAMFSSSEWGVQVLYQWGKAPRMRRCENGVWTAWTFVLTSTQGQAMTFTF